MNAKDTPDRQTSFGHEAVRVSADRDRFRSAVVKVLGIQVVSLIVLWLLQRSFS